MTGTDFLSYYDDLLALWGLELGIDEVPPLAELMHPRAAEVYGKALDIGRKLGAAAACPFSVGGSAYCAGGRSCLLAGEDLDIDLRLWAQSSERVDTIAAIVGALVGSGRPVDRSAAPDLRAVGGRALSLSWSESVAGEAARVEVLIRVAPAVPYRSVAEKRLEVLDDLRLARYLAIKKRLYALDDRRRLKVFKKSELRLWDVDDEVLAFLAGLHEACVRPLSRRKSGERHGDHMVETAMLSVVLGGDRLDFLTAGLHDCLEESRDRAVARNILRDALQERFLRLGEDDPEGLADEIVSRIELLTERWGTSGSSEAAARRLAVALDRLGITAKADGELAAYVRDYTVFHRILVSERARVAIPEIADRWAGLRKRGFLVAYEGARRAVTLMRWSAILSSLEAPRLVRETMRSACQEFGLDPDAAAEAAATLFSE